MAELESMPGPLGREVYAQFRVRYVEALQRLAQCDEYLGRLVVEIVAHSGETFRPGIVYDVPSSYPDYNDTRFYHPIEDEGSGFTVYRRTRWPAELRWDGVVAEAPDRVAARLWHDNDLPIDVIRAAAFEVMDRREREESATATAGEPPQALSA